VIDHASAGIPPVAWIGNLGGVGFQYVRLLRRADIAADLFLARNYLNRQSPGNPEHEWEGASDLDFLHPHPRSVTNHIVNRMGHIGWPAAWERRIGQSHGLVQAQTCNEINAMRIKQAYGLPYCGLTTGSDLSEVAVGDSAFSRLYRKSLEQAEHVFLVNIDQFETLSRASLSLKSFGFLPFSVDLEHLKPTSNHLSDRLIIFCAARLDWRSKDRASIKANDIFFRGFADFHQRHPDVECALRVADWGVDREATRDLVGSLGIADTVTFVPFGDKSVFYDNVKSAHLVVDQFSLGAVGLTAIEGMALGRPVMAAVDQVAALRAYGVEMPILNCTNPAEVCRTLASLNPATIMAHSEASSNWVRTHHSDEHIREILCGVYETLYAQ
jgi:glycosyltransferase involved in cell wall biosynthesis